jgi:hypothetical protein
MSGTFNTGNAPSQKVCVDRDPATDEDNFNANHKSLREPEGKMNSQNIDLHQNVARFIRDEMIYNPTVLSTGADVYRRFVFWCEGNGIKAATKNDFYKEMQSQGWRVPGLSVGRIVVGLRVRKA